MERVPPKEGETLLPTSKSRPQARQPHALLGVACVAVSAVCFSLMSTMVKYDTYIMTSMEAIFWRSLAAFFFNLIAVASTRKSLYVKPQMRMRLFWRCVYGFSSISFAFYAVSQMVLADASVIIFTSPVMTFFLGACMLGERIDPPSFMCAVISFSGVVCVVRPSFIFGNSHFVAENSNWVAVGSAFLGALGQALVFISVRKLQGIHSLVIVHYFMLSSMIASLIYVVTVQQRFVLPSTRTEWASVIGCGLFTFVGQMFLTKGFQLESAGIASVMRYLDVVCVFIWDDVLLGEKINHWSIVGAVIICTCAIVIALRKAKLI